MSVFAARRRKDKERKSNKDKAKDKAKKAKKEKKERQEAPEAKFTPAPTEEVAEEKPMKEFFTKPKTEHQEIFSPAQEEEPKKEVKEEAPAPVKRGRKKSQKVKLREFQIYQSVRSSGSKGIKKGDIAKQTGITDYLIYQSLKTLEENGKVELIEGTRFWRSKD